MQNLHQQQPIQTAGEPLNQATAVMVMIHGRGASTESILSLVPEIHEAGFAYFAPQAANNTWYPNRFLAPLESNEPYLSSALSVVGGIIDTIRQAGIPDEKIMLLGFSQGACLALEYAARNAQQYGGVVGLSGGLIGPDELPRDYAGSFDGTPVFLGCSDVDFHVPKERVDLTATLFKKLGAVVTERLYPNMGHTVNEDELTFVRHMMTNLVR
jgi:phospholipase/carboxylesterase